ncbi:MAG: SPOR domain-containing protein [Candidatus Omnitrophota bacterium]
MRPRQLNLFGIKKDKNKDPKREGIVIPVDTTILLLVVIILLLIIAFSWGVERGRKLTLRDLSIKTKRKEEVKDKKETNDRVDKEKDREKKEKIKTKEEIEAKVEEEKGKDKTVEIKKPLYRIQVASFRKLASANQEAKKLRKKGYSVKVEEKGKYSVVYVGKFENKKNAEKGLKKLKKIYKDCVLRRL